MVPHLSISTLLILLAVIGYAVNRVAEERGWSRPSRLVRQENLDLIRRNGELEATINRHEIALAAYKVEIDQLKTTVADLRARDQGAVLAQLERHETSARRRHEEHLAMAGTTNETLREIADAMKERTR